MRELLGPLEHWTAALVQSQQGDRLVLCCIHYTERLVKAGMQIPDLDADRLHLKGCPF